MACAGGSSPVSQSAQRGVSRRVALAGDQNESMITQPVPRIRRWRAIAGTLSSKLYGNPVSLPAELADVARLDDRALPAAAHAFRRQESRSPAWVVVGRC